MPLLHRFGARRCVLVLTTVGVTARMVSADDLVKASVKSMVAVRTPTPPTIDGQLDDAVWDLASPDDRFIQRFPHDGAPTVHRTTIRVLYDDSAVYVGMRMEDDEADKIVARLTRRDRVVDSDFVTVALDSRHDHSTGYFFTLNAAGVQLDGTFFDDTSMTYDWDAVWDGSVSRDAGGWSAEFKIPLSVLRFPDTAVQEWGIQAERYVARTQEDDRWSYTPQDVQANVSPMGHLTGLLGLHPRRTWELLPFTVARLRSHTDSGNGFLGFGSAMDPKVTPDATLGLDAKIGLTSNLTLAATVNPDFGQVDADEVVLNLSRFETFFPEKRPFFLEGADLFHTDFGQFYSRRIGRGFNAPDSFVDDDGTTVTVHEPSQPVPIRAAIKVTGKVSDDLSVGVIDAVTAPEEVKAVDESTGKSRTVRFVPYMNYAVLRTKYAVQGASYLGFLATAATRLDGQARNASEDHDGYTQGVQGLWQSNDSRWRVANEAVVSERVGGPAYQTGILLSRPDGTLQAPGDVGVGGRGSVNYTGVHWGLSVDYRALSPRLDLNDLGFQSEFNVFGGDATLTYQELRPHGPIQNYSFSVASEEFRTFDNIVTERLIGLYSSVRFTNFWSLNAFSGIGLPGRWLTTETGDGASLERARANSLTVSVQSDTRRKVQFYGLASAIHTIGQPTWTFTSMDQLTFNLIPTLQLDLSSQVGLTYQATRFWFPDGCTDDLGNACTPLTMNRNYIFGQLDSGSISLTSHATYTFSPRLSLQGYAQLFMARGHFASYAGLATVGLHPFVHLSDLHQQAHISDLPMPPDSTIYNDANGDFQQVALNVNLVFRWEFLPGSALLVVYSRAQSGEIPDDLTGRPRFTPSGLSNGPTEDVFLVKLSYFMR